ncbi:D-arabinono-1,4-lactone oxidase [uncultured Microbacterium sp.]|uniref:D-arabinono-1,4-lactone oxidase n=1 Tax=uncultured Microbacterium sp. TaxID=191216 RepID=UPI0035C94DB6
MTDTTLPEIAPWQNWLNNERFDTRHVIPHSEAEVLDIVNLARSRSENVRVVGTGHSSSPLCRNEGFLISLDNLQGVISGDTERGRAVVHAGTKINSLGLPLWERGFSLTNQGEIDRQAIAGAIGTGTHGTGLQLKNISSALTRARIVTGTGKIIEIDESSPDHLAAARVSLGMLGVFTEIELAVSPAYELHEWHGFAPFDVVFPHSLDLATSHRNFSLLWFPTHQACVNFDTVPEGATDASDTCFIKIYEKSGTEVDAGPIAEYGSVRRTERAYRVYPDDWEPLFYEMEYMMPIDRGLACYAASRDVVREKFPQSHMPVQLRFVAADDSFLSQNYGRPSAVVSVTAEPGKIPDGYFETFDELFTAHGGRPHWGKLHHTSLERLDDQFPKVERFREIRRELDPEGVFLNSYLEPLFA